MFIIGLSGKLGTGKTTVAKGLRKEFYNHGYKRNILRMAFADGIKEEVERLYGIPMSVMLDPIKKNTQVFDLEKTATSEGLDLYKRYAKIHANNTTNKLFKRSMLLFFIACISTIIPISGIVAAIVFSTLFLLSSITGILAVRNKVSTKVTARHLMQFHGTSIRRYTCGNQYWTNIMVKRLKNLIETEPTINTIFIDDIRYDHEIEAIKENFGKNCYIVRLNPYKGYYPTFINKLKNRLKGNKSPNYNHESETNLDNKNYLFHKVYNPKYGKLGNVVDDIINHLIKYFPELGLK